MNAGGCLVIHFDVNKTIIMSDIGAGRDFMGTLNSLLSECSWGLYDRTIPYDSRKPCDWILCSSIPSTSPPQENAVSFGSYLEDHTPMQKKDRVSLKTTFTNEGCVGSVFQPYLLQLKDKLTVPSSSFENLEFYQLLPSFFVAVMYLIEQHINFRIVFRTFGVDIPSIAAEYNLFCNGDHPQFTPPHIVNGSDSNYAHDLRLHLPEGSGKLLRTADGPGGVQLAYVANDKTVQIASGHSAVDTIIINEWLGLHSTPSSNKSDIRYAVAIRDDFNWWHTINNEACTAGKLFLINQNNSEYTNIKEIFFDDNIERDRAHIVDIRDRQTFQPIAFEEAVSKHYLHRVEPYDAIMNTNYYVDILKSVLADQS